eukprot:730764-Heterocapsa_arctica.AAC.2
MNKAVRDRIQREKDKADNEYNESTETGQTQDIEEGQIAEIDNNDTDDRQTQEEEEQTLAVPNGSPNVEGHIKNFQRRIDEKNERERKQLTDEVFKQNKKAKTDNINRNVIAEERKRKEGNQQHITITQKKIKWTIMEHLQGRKDNERASSSNEVPNRTIPMSDNPVGTHHPAHSNNPAPIEYPGAVHHPAPP